MKVIKKKRIAVIGGGVSGVAAAKAFAEVGHEVIGFERTGSLGGVWAPGRSYPGVKTQSPKDLYRFTDLNMPLEYPEWPSGSQVLSYLYTYAEKHQLVKLFRLNTTVVGMKEREDGKQGWTLILSCDLDQEEYTLDFDFVVICSGMFTDPNTVVHSGQDQFIEDAEGIVLHSSSYSSISNDMKDRKVVVVGGSKSATDIAVHAASNGASQVTLVYRRNVWRIPQYIAGINFKHLLYMRAQEIQFNSWSVGRSRLSRLVLLLFAPIIWINFRALEALLTIQLGLNKWKMVPNERIEDAVSCELPVVTNGLFECFRQGSIKPIHSTIEKYIFMDKHGGIEMKEDEKKPRMAVLLRDGNIIEVDTVIQATGWTMNLGFLPKRLQETLIDQRDGQFRLYRFAVNPNVPNIGFVGLNSSFASVLCSELLSNWMVRYVDGMLRHLPSPDEMEEKIASFVHWKRTERPAALVYDGNCVAPFHHLHFDEILNDMGATFTNGSLFRYPDAETYGKCLDSLQKYTVKDE